VSPPVELEEEVVPPAEPEPDELSLADLELSDQDLDLEEADVGPAAPEAEGPPATEEPAEEIDLESWELGADADWAAAAEPEPLEAPPGGEDVEEPGPVTVEDLMAAPPEYAGLPPPDEGEAGPEEGAPVGAAEEGLGAEEEDRDVTQQFDVEPVEASAAPDVEAAEAAADHFAEGIPPEEIERELLADLGPPGDQTVRIEPSGEPAPAEPTVEAAEEAPPSEAEADALAPPTWQEEGAQPVEAEPEEAAAAPQPPLAGRNLVAAFASGILLAALVIVLLVIGKGPFAVFAGIVILLGQAEFYAVLQSRGHRPATLPGLVAGAFTVAGAYLRGEAGIAFGMFMAVALSALWYMAASPASRRQTTGQIGATLLGVLYVPGLASFALLLLALPGDLGTNVFLAMLGLTILYDICAYMAGSLFGRRPLAPTISPSKSWEGAIGATVLLLFLSLLIVSSIDPFTSATAAGLAILIAIAAPIGDLVESAFKRDLGVKDMGTILPGHGGILDRIDAILFTAPVAYYFLRIAFFG
jgi:phosphatidate cytidylyltransferase